MDMNRGSMTNRFAFTALILAGFTAAISRADTPATQTSTPVAVVRLEGKVDDFNRDGFFSRFNQAQASGAKTIIVDLDTYGGLVTSGLDISRFLKSQDVHTIAYVGDKAISAGAMIALACNEIVMAPSAQLGDCAPIAFREDGGLESLGEAERAKQESPVLSEFRDSALRNGYDPLLAQAMVSVKTVVHWVQNPTSGPRRFVDEKEFADLSKQGWTDVREANVPVPIDSESTLLTVNGKTAAAIGLAREERPTIGALIEARSYDVVATYAPGAGDKLIEWLNNPFVRMLLMVLFAQCLYAALHAPGHGFAEVLAVLALAILVGVPLLTGYAQWWEILVILVGVILLALEIFVIPGFGLTGILGIVMVLFGLVMTFVGREPAGPGFWPKLEGTWTNVRNGVAMVAIALICSMLLALWLRRHLPKLPYLRRLILTTTTGNLNELATTPRAADAPRADKPAVGAIGEAMSELKPGGSATFYDPITGDQRVFSVLSDVGYIPRGTKIAVRSTDDNRVVVRPIVLS